MYQYLASKGGDFEIRYRMTVGLATKSLNAGRG